MGRHRSAAVHQQHQVHVLARCDAVRSDIARSDTSSRPSRRGPIPTRHRDRDPGGASLVSSAPDRARPFCSWPTVAPWPQRSRCGCVRPCRPVSLDWRSRVAKRAGTAGSYPAPLHRVVRSVRATCRANPSTTPRRLCLLTPRTLLVELARRLFKPLCHLDDRSSGSAASSNAVANASRTHRSRPPFGTESLPDGVQLTC